MVRYSQSSNCPRECTTKIERFFLQGPAGRLEALLEHDPDSQPRLAALVCHPHPIYGGTMHNKVVYRAAKAAIQAGVPTLRFNFRGVHKSEGEFAGGTSEKDDVRAALDELERRYPRTPVCLMGFSFGAGVGLAVGATDPRVTILVGLGLPTKSMDLGFLREVHKPKLIVQGTRDEHGPREQVESLCESLADPKQLVWVENADHFFADKLEKVQTAVRRFVEEWLSAPPAA